MGTRRRTRPRAPGRRRGRAERPHALQRLALVLELAALLGVRVAPGRLGERVRQANKLDTMSEDGASWDKDFTAEMVKACEEKHAVLAKT